MPQFSVYQNPNEATKARFPLLLDAQTDLLSEIATRIVVPLCAATPAARRSAMHAVTPICRVAGKDYIVLTPQLAGVLRSDLGPKVGDLSQDRAMLLDALDFLTRGI